MFDKEKWSETLLEAKLELGDDSWTEVELLPDGSDYVVRFLLWLRANIVNESLPTELLGRHVKMLDELCSDMDTVNLSYVCDKLADVVGLSSSVIVGYLWEFGVVNNGFLDEVYELANDVVCNP